MQKESQRCSCFAKGKGRPVRCFVMDGNLLSRLNKTFFLKTMAKTDAKYYQNVFTPKKTMLVTKILH